ncbi:MAG: hypothetical protein KAV82_01685, partial [Phycisphaerae bacterium]|nr:hypothetical protein [Phycisphaerae bacterium]
WVEPAAGRWNPPTGVVGFARLRRASPTLRSWGTHVSKLTLRAWTAMMKLTGGTEAGSGGVQPARDIAGWVCNEGASLRGKLPPAYGSM